MMDVALDLGRLLKRDTLPANDARDFASHDHLLACNHACDLATFSNDNLDGLHVAFDLAINLKQASADDFESLTDDFEIVAYDRLLTSRRCTEV